MMSTLKVVLFLLLSIHRTASAHENCHSLFQNESGPQNSVRQVYKALVQRNGWINDIAIQIDFDNFIKPSGGGACASVTAFNLVQFFRLMDQQKLLNPSLTLQSAYAQMPELLDGRVSNGQMARLLTFFQKEYMPGSKLEISAASTHALKPNEPNQRIWSIGDAQLLEARANEIKILAYTVARPDGEVLGRHFVILIGKSQSNKISVFDSDAPHRNTEYYLRTEEIDNGHVSLRLVKPKAAASSVVLTVDSIFTVRLN